MPIPVALTLAFILGALSLWFAYPLGWLLWASLTEQSLGQSARFVGLANYREALSDGAAFWSAVRITLVFACCETVLGIVLALATALGIGRVRHSVLRWLTPIMLLAFFCPMTMALVAASLVWRHLFDPRFGIVNQLLASFAESTGMPLLEIGWTSTTDWALPTVILFAIWKNFGFRVLILLTTLHAIPGTYLDCARLDGAGSWRRFRDIVLPILGPTIVFLLVSGLISSMQVYAPVYMITEGGPVDASRTLMIRVVESMEYGRLGFASALSVLTGLTTICLTLLLLLYRRWHTQQGAAR